MAVSRKERLELLKRRRAALRARMRPRPGVGEAPGTPVFTGEATAAEVSFAVMDYSEADHEELGVDDAEALFAYRDRETVSWISVNGVHDVTAIAQIGRHFRLHPLIQEDIANTTQRPKVEEYDPHVYLVLRMIRFDTAAEQITSQQVSLILGPGYVLTFQEHDGDVFESVRERIRTAKGRIRQAGADYLFYALLDALVDGYFSVLEGVGNRVEAIEDVVMTDPQPTTLADIHHLRTQVMFLRRSVWPLREAVSNLERTESSLVAKDTRAYLRDVYGHTIQLMDSVESFRDVAASLFETHLSMVSNRMNEVMKVLTIIATIFIPITFVAGIYGMNFEHMPELQHRWAYPAVWGVMIATVLVMLAYFRRKKWI